MRVFQCSTTNERNSPLSVPDCRLFAPVVASASAVAVGLVVAVNSKALYNLMAAFIGQGDFGCSGGGGRTAVIFLQLPPRTIVIAPFSSVRLAHKF